MNELICIRCPLGCRLLVDEALNVSGNQCPRGREYAVEELTAPKRIVTSLVLIKDCDEPLSVKSSEPIPKELVFEALKEIKKLKPSLPVKIGEVLIENVLGSGVDIVSTKALG